MLGFVYFMTNQPNGILYVGVTNDIARRAWEHREGLVEGFTKRYRLHRLAMWKSERQLEPTAQKRQRKRIARRIGNPLSLKPQRFRYGARRLIGRLRREGITIAMTAGSGLGRLLIPVNHGANICLRTRASYSCRRIARAGGAGGN